MTESRTMYVLNSRSLEINKKEVLGYLRVKESNDQIDALIDECIEQIYETASPRAVYIETKVDILDDLISFDFMSVKSHSLAINLKGCSRAYVFGATLGLEVDRLIDKYSKILQSKASVLHAVGSALIESLCDYVNRALIEGKCCARRFSPGYGDLSLECQCDVIRALDAQRKIGITLSDSLLMSPSKSVTAIIGIK